LTLSISLDGFGAGPDQSLADPLGVGGERLHEWAIRLQTWREAHGYEGGEVNASSEVMESTLRDVGATIMGRRMFGGGPGPWNMADPWNGWWGDRPPFGHPVFVLTHHPREPLELEGTTFTFVTDGIESALEQASGAADGQVVAVAGGSQTAQQYLAAGLVDEMTIHIVPTLLGGGERLFENVGTDMHGLELAETVSGPGVAHLRFERR
jgi:dihydrofolate reductase